MSKYNKVDFSELNNIDAICGQASLSLPELKEIMNLEKEYGFYVADSGDELHFVIENIPNKEIYYVKVEAFLDENGKIIVDKFLKFCGLVYPKEWIDYLNWLFNLEKPKELGVPVSFYNAFRDKYIVEWATLRFFVERTAIKKGLNLFDDCTVFKLENLHTDLISFNKVTLRKLKGYENVDVSNITWYKMGTRKKPEVVSLTKMSKRLNVSLSKLSILVRKNKQLDRKFYYVKGYTMR